MDEKVKQLRDGAPKLLSEALEILNISSPDNIELKRITSALAVLCQNLDQRVCVLEGLERQS